MNFLPPKETNIHALMKKGYDVHYTKVDPDADDPLSDILGGRDIDNAYRETVIKDDIVQAPNGEPSIKYFDRNTGKIIGALWTNSEGKPHRENKPAALFERSKETGSYGDYHKDYAYCINGEYHHDSDASLVFAIAVEGSDRLVNIFEEWSTQGKMNRVIMRDMASGKITSDSDDPHLESNDTYLEL